MCLTFKPFLIQTSLWHNLLIYKYVHLYCIAVSLWTVPTSTRHTYTCDMSQFTPKTMWHVIWSRMYNSAVPQSPSQSLYVSVCQCTCH